MAIGADEQADEDLVNSLLFEPNSIKAVTYTEKEKNQGKTPDFKLMKDGKLLAYCEMKSTKHPENFVDPFIEKKGETRIIRRIPATPKNLSRHIINAADQLEAANPDREIPNVMVIVNHVEGRERKDLHVSIVGAEFVDGSGKLYFLKKPLQINVWEKARKIDLFLWVDANKKTFLHVYPDDAPHRKAACELFGIKMDTDVAKATSSQSLK